MIRRALFWLGLVLVLAVVNGQILAKQRILDRGTVMLLPLAPVDPRSLMQGDYMRLRYADPVPQEVELPERGVLVVSLNDRAVTFRRLDDGRPLAPDEHRLAFRQSERQSWWARERRDILFAANSFLFQEGLADTYAQARFAILKVAEDGTALLTGLADADRVEIKPR